MTTNKERKVPLKKVMLKVFPKINTKKLWITTANRTECTHNLQTLYMRLHIQTYIIKHHEIEENIFHLTLERWKISCPNLPVRRDCPDLLF